MSRDREKLKLSKSLLRSFAKGELDDELEAKIIAALASKPKLKSQVAAISIDYIVAKLSSNDSQPSESDTESQAKSKSSQGEPISADVLSELKEYQIIREIGRGGMGTIYLAKNEWMGNRKEVLKVLNESMYGNEDARARFQREIECTASLDHPNIVGSYSVRPLKDSIVFSMEYVRGNDALYARLGTA